MTNLLNWTQKRTSEKISIMNYEQNQPKLGTVLENKVPYVRHYNLLLNANHTEDQNFTKKLRKKSFLTFKKWVEKIQTAG